MIYSKLITPARRLKTPQTSRPSFPFVIPEISVCNRTKSEGSQNCNLPKLEEAVRGVQFGCQSQSCNEHCQHHVIRPGCHLSVVRIRNRR